MILSEDLFVFLKWLSYGYVQKYVACLKMKVDLENNNILMECFKKYFKKWLYCKKYTEKTDSFQNMLNHLSK